MHWKYLLFDLDGTLTDPMQGITRSVQYALRHFGIEVEDLTTLCTHCQLQNFLKWVRPRM